MHVLEARDVSMRGCGRSLLQRVSITADRGELLAPCRPEGSGTRTLLHLLSGHLFADAGRVLVDGRERGPRRVPAAADPRRLGFGAAEAPALLSEPCDRDLLLLDRPTDGLGARAGDELLAAARRRAEAGAAVVVTADSPQLVVRHPTTVAMFVAGRMLSWAAPPVALVPAVHFLSAGREGSGVVQAGSIITSST